MQVLSVHGRIGEYTAEACDLYKKTRNIKIISKHVLGFNFTLKVHYGKVDNHLISTIPYMQK